MILYFFGLFSIKNWPMQQSIFHTKYVMTNLKTNDFYLGSHMELFKGLNIQTFSLSKHNEYIQRSKSIVFYPYITQILIGCLTNLSFKKVQCGCQGKNCSVSLFSEFILSEVYSSKYNNIKLMSKKFYFASLEIMLDILYRLQKVTSRFIKIGN